MLTATAMQLAQAGGLAALVEEQLHGVKLRHTRTRKRGSTRARAHAGRSWSAPKAGAYGPAKGVGSSGVCDLVGMDGEGDAAVGGSHVRLRRGGERQLEHGKLVRRRTDAIYGRGRRSAIGNVGRRRSGWQEELDVMRVAREELTARHAGVVVCHHRAIDCDAIQQGKVCGCVRMFLVVSAQEWAKDSNGEWLCQEF